MATNDVSSSYQAREAKRPVFCNWSLTSEVMAKLTLNYSSRFLQVVVDCSLLTEDANAYLQP